MKRFLTAALAALLMMTLAGCDRGAGENTVFDAEDMAGRTVGVLADSASAGYIARYPHALSYRTYDDVEAMAVELKNGAIDCVLADRSTARQLTRASSRLTELEEPYLDQDYCMAVSIENTLLLEKLNEALETLRSTGRLEELSEDWSHREPEETPEDPELTPISVAVDPSFYPYAYYDEEGNLAGIEVELVREVCQVLDLTPEFSASDSDILLYTAESGKTAFAIGRLVPDPDNEALAFTDPYMHSTQLIVVRK